MNTRTKLSFELTFRKFSETVDVFESAVESIRLIENNSQNSNFLSVNS